MDEDVKRLEQNGTPAQSQDDCRYLTNAYTMLDLQKSSRASQCSLSRLI